MYILSIDVAEIRELIESNEYNDAFLELLKSYESLGPLTGILLPFFEAFFPFLPLVVFVMTNAAAYGLLQGFLLSWIGASAGAMCVFFIVRKLGEKRFFKWIRKNKQVKRVTNWLEKHGFGPLFLLMCFPFSPSSIINVVAGLSKISIQQFALAVLLGKTVMIFTISYIGDSIMSFAKNPIKTIVVGVCIALFWAIGKFIERRLQKRANAHNNVQAKDD
ncbi:TVP38/TMEM64 family protein [Aquibacillus halophilus]|uniref:TVP38/TMEM64 family membrane protein n=1 Tax=Aquibacillus halophilus TaxID=930132 RepID=A0A6A8DG20_9BACI|nr:TVP38/TMEM64 family protein [Aquibacillus halophilus]MRH44170.1 TVP38/TMEM64 family protein [Aquibacillus halophilus]